MKTILLDTNMLLVPGQLNIDIFGEVERVCLFPYTIKILSRTREEIESIIKTQKGKDKLAAKLALQLIEKLKIEEISSVGHVDKALVIAAKSGAIIVTIDKGITSELKKMSLPYITVRKKQHLVFIN